MNSLYMRLAGQNIKKHRRSYVPYMLTGILTAAVYYILHSLAINPDVGETASAMLNLGVVIVMVFSVIFLFYTNSFLMKQRKKEFGLYNILGMDKINLSRVLFWENAVIFCISMAAGLACGLLFSKFAQLLMVNILTAGADFSLSVSPDSIGTTFLWFAVIFILILLSALRQIHMTNPVDLLKSESTGEKPPLGSYPMVGAWSSPSFTGFTGRDTTTRPPGSRRRSTTREPPWSRTISRAIFRPRPRSPVRRAMGSSPCSSRRPLSHTVSVARPPS